MGNVSSVEYKFGNVGTFPLEPPSDDLKPFMRKKLKVWFRKNSAVKGGMCQRKDMEKLAAQHFDKEKYDKVEKQKRAQKFVEDVYGTVFFFGKESITEDEFVEKWMEKIFYTEPKAKMNWIIKLLDLAKYGFDPIDSNKNGVIEIDEFKNWFLAQEFQVTINQIEELFRGLDVDKDGFISMAEFQYGLVYHNMCSGPDSIFSLWFGPVDEA